MAESGAGGNISFENTTLENTRITGVTADYAEFSGYNPAAGRIPSRLEVERSRACRPARLGHRRGPLQGTRSGRQGRADPRHALPRRGRRRKKGSVFGNSQDEFAVIPLGSFQKLFGARRSLEVTVKPVDPSLLPETMDEARVALRIKRHLRAREEDNFGMVTSDTLMDFWRAFSSGIFAVLLGVVSLSLVVGGIVIMNIMLMVVSERTREIGLRKALGARRRDIVWQILTESTTLSTAGGLIGTALGFVVAHGWSRR